MNPTPGTCARLRTTTSSTKRLNSVVGSVSEVIAIDRIGDSAGLVFWYVGGFGRLRGSVPPAALMAVCTSCAAASMSRSRSKRSVMFVVPIELADVLSTVPGVEEKARPGGGARELAMGLAA